MASPAEEKKTDEEQRNWAELSPEIMASILSRLTMVDTLKSAQFVCKSWHEVSKNPLLWKRIEVRRNFASRDPNKMYRNAIDWSCGQAVEVDLEHFGDNELFKYICDRSNKIKRLRIHWCDGINDKSLIENIAKLPLLEKLELGLWSFPTELFETLGLHCPSLESLTLISLNTFAGLFRRETDRHTNEDMIAIGKCIPGLRSLKVVGNSMTIEGLEAILEGCTLLESLDLHNCANICAKGEVWERCTKQVKKLCRLTIMEKHLFTALTSEYLCGPYGGDSDDDYD